MTEGAATAVFLRRPGLTLTYDYDALDRVRRITYLDGSFEQFEYEDHFK